MVKVISAPNSLTTVVALARGSMFYSAGIVPEGIDKLAKTDIIASGETRLIAKQDLVIVVEGLWHDPCTGANHVMFVRADRTSEGMGSLWFARPQYYPGLREALMDAKIPHIESVGGFDHVLLYGDEVAIPESYGGFGFYGWIIKRDDVAKYLHARSAKDNPPKMGRITIWHEIHWNHNAERFPVIRIEGWSEPPIKDDVTLWSVAEYIVLFDQKSRIIQRITLTNTDVAGVSCDRAPIRSVAVGKRLPNNLAWKR